MKRRFGRFVVLKHSRTEEPVHYDLMLETEKDALLTTYSLSVSPCELAHRRHASCKQIDDHDRKFLTYQGKVNNGKGTVERVDEGKAEIISLAPLKCRLHGKKLNCLLEQKKQP
jgi:hypothetical protein